MSEKLLPVLSLRIFFSLRIFMVLGLTFRSSVHFEFIFVYGERKWSNFTLLHMAVQLSQHHLLKRVSFFPFIFTPPLSKIDHITVDLFLDFLLCIYFYTSAILFWLPQLCNITWNLELWYLQFCSSRLLWLFKVFCGSIQILGLFVPALWKCWWYFDRDCIECIDGCG